MLTQCKAHVKFTLELLKLLKTVCHLIHLTAFSVPQLKSSACSAGMKSDGLVQFFAISDLTHARVKISQKFHRPFGPMAFKV